MKVGIVVKSLPQFDKDALIKEFGEVWKPETTAHLNFSEPIHAKFYGRGTGDGAILLWPSDYFIEERERSWLTRFFLGDVQQLKSDIDKRVDDVVAMYREVEKTIHIVKIVISNADRVPLSLLETVVDMIRCRENIPADWIHLWDPTKPDYTQFVNDCIIRSAAIKDMKV